MANEILERYRAKYPKYRDVSDSVLAAGIVAKYPQYKANLADVLSGGGAPTPEPQATPVPSLGAEMSQIWNEPGLQAQKGIAQFPINRAAGVLNVGVGAAKAVGAPFASVAAASRRYAPPPERFAQAGIEYGLGKVGEFFGGHAGAATEYVLSKASGQPATAPFIQDIREPAAEAGAMAGQALVTGGIAKGVAKVPAVGRGALKASDKLMTGALKAGENLERVNELARFANDRGITMTEQGQGVAGNIKLRMQTGVDQIVEGLTESGRRVPGDRFIKAVREGGEEIGSFGGVKRKKVGKQVEGLVRDLEETLAKNNGTLSPRQIQDFKVELNKELDRLYTKKAKEGTLTKSETTEFQLLERLNREYRTSLEELHPAIRGLNQEESRAIDVGREIESYRYKKAIGDPRINFPGATRVGTGQVAAGPLYVFAEAVSSRALRSKVAVNLNKTGSFLTGRAIPNGPPFPMPIPPNPEPIGLLGAPKTQIPQYATPGGVQTHLGGVPTPGPYIHYGVVSPSAPKQLPPIGGTSRGPIPMGPVPQVTIGPDDLRVTTGRPGPGYPTGTRQQPRMVPPPWTPETGGEFFGPAPKFGNVIEGPPIKRKRKK